MERGPNMINWETLQGNYHTKNIFQKDETDVSKAFCRICQNSFEAKDTMLWNHIDSEPHQTLLFRWKIKTAYRTIRFNLQNGEPIVRLKITTQPTNRYHFRYLSDGIRGPLKGENGRWPAVELEYVKLNNMNNDPIQIVCQLVRKYKDDGQFMVSANILRPHKSDNHSIISPNQMVCHEKIRKLYKFELADHCIVKTKVNDIEKCFTELRPYLMPGLVPIPEVELAKKMHKKHETVHLAFTAYQIQGQFRVQMAETIYSQGISNLNSKLFINKCCNPHIPFEGQTHIHLLLTDVKQDYNIKIKSSTGNGWESELLAPEKSEEQQKHKAAHNLLVYKAPKYGGPYTPAETSINCQLMLYLDNNSTHIQQVDIVYVRYNTKVLRQIMYNDNSEEFEFDDTNEASLNDIDMDNLDLSNEANNDNMPTREVYQNFENMMQIDLNQQNNFAMVQQGLYEMKELLGAINSTPGRHINAVWRKLVNIDNLYLVWRRNSNTSIFHEALKLRQLGLLRQVFDSINDNALKDACVERLALLPDEQNRTLLHIQALLKAPAISLPIESQNNAWLVSQCAKHSLGMQNIDGNTFLHIAVDKERTDLMHYAEQSLNRLQMEQLLNVYDRNGYTALHAAVVSEKTESLKWLVECYSKLGLNACEVRTLVDGATALHLALKGKKSQIYEQLILEAFSDAADYDDYAGCNPYNKFLNVEDESLATVAVQPNNGSDDSEEEDDHAVRRNMERLAGLQIISRRA